MIKMEVIDNYTAVLDMIVYLERHYPNTINVTVETISFGVNRMRFMISIEDKSK